MFIRLFAVCLVTALGLGLPGTAAGQVAAAGTPTYEFSGGYQLLRLRHQTLPLGVNIDAARNVGGLGVVGEIGWARNDEEFDGDPVSLNVWNIGAGARWTRHHAGRIWPFVQLLGGVAVSHGSMGIGAVDESDTQTSFMLQPGVGLSIPAGDGWGFVGQVDYRRTFFDVADDTDYEVNNQIRAFIGVRLILD